MLFSLVDIMKYLQWPLSFIVLVHDKIALSFAFELFLDKWLKLRANMNLCIKSLHPILHPSTLRMKLFPLRDLNPIARHFFSRRRRSCDPQGRGKVTLLKSILSEKVVRGNNELRESLSQRINQKCSNKIQVSYPEGSTWNKRQVLRSLTFKKDETW